jgi:hypothetical protein
MGNEEITGRQQWALLCERHQSHVVRARAGPLGQGGVATQRHHCGHWQRAQGLDDLGKGKLSVREHRGVGAQGRQYERPVRGQPGDGRVSRTRILELLMPCPIPGSSIHRDWQALVDELHMYR